MADEMWILCVVEGGYVAVTRQGLLYSIERTHEGHEHGSLSPLFDIACYGEWVAGVEHAFKNTPLSPSVGVKTLLLSIKV